MNFFTTSIKVRSYECDVYGHVNNATYLNYCEHARVELLNELGYSLNSLMKEGFILPIVNISIDYKLPAFEGDLLSIGVNWIKRGKSSATFRQEITRGKDGKLVAKADITWVTANLKGKPIAIPESFLERWQEKYKNLPEVK